MNDQNFDPMQPQPAAPAPTPMPDPAPAAPMTDPMMSPAPAPTPAQEPAAPMGPDPMAPAATPMAGPAPMATPAPAAPAAMPSFTGEPASAATPAPAVTPQKKKSKVGLIIGIVIGVLVLVGGIIGVIALLGNTGGDMDDIYATNVFFLRNDDDMYAMFNDDGEQMSEFIYSDATRFIGGTAAVSDKEGNYGIINTDGKMTVKFGKYKFISRAGGLYEATDNNSKEFLINGNGKVIYDLEKNKLVTSSDSFAVVADDKGFQVMNYQGKKALSLTENLDKDIKLSDEESGYVIVGHADVNYLINTMTAELVTKFDTKDVYRVYQVDKDRKAIALVYSPEEYTSSSDYKYKLVVDGKEGMPDGCKAAATAYSIWLCLDTNGEDIYLLDEDFKKTDIEYDSNSHFIDSKNYVLVEDDDDTGVSSVVFYKDGGKVEKVKCHTVGSYGPVLNNMYLLRTRTSYTRGSECYDVDYGNYEYYTTDGKKAIDKVYKYAEPFSKSGVAAVRDQDNKYYIINDKGDKLSDGYSYIYSRSSDELTYYYAYNTYGDYDVLNDTGKVIAKTTSSYSIGADVFKDELYIYVRTSSDDKTYDIYRAKDGEKVAESEDYPYLLDHYIEATGGGKVKFYSYNGKLMLERKDDDD